MKNQFKGEYTISDGYVGGSRPQYFRVSSDELEDDMTDEDLERFYEEMAEESFQEHIGINVMRVDAFIEWARGVLAARSSGE